MKISVIETESGCFIKISSYYPTVNNILVNGVAPRPTHNKEWYKVDKFPTKVEELVPPQTINRRFELIDKTLESDKFPLTLSCVQVWNDDGEWSEDYRMLESLYRLAFDYTESRYEPVKFEAELICKIDNIEEYAGFSYPIREKRWSKDVVLLLDESAIKHQVIDTIVFPDLILASKPSELSSEHSYKIIRQHVIANIDPHVAKISSNYDFCFAVDKLIDLCEPEAYRADISRGKKRPKYETRYRKARTIGIFEMTHDVAKYAKYTPIKGFSGKNHGDLKKNIDKFLKELMDKINEPLKDCPHCKGMGVIVCMTIN
jgi:hypothetical protein